MPLRSSIVLEIFRIQFCRLRCGLETASCRSELVYSWVLMLHIIVYRSYYPFGNTHASNLEVPDGYFG